MVRKQVAAGLEGLRTPAVRPFSVLANAVGRGWAAVNCCLVLAD